jgi:1-acyl-sn-glycerol-3-phosphate acyltransferase
LVFYTGSVFYVLAGIAVMPLGAGPVRQVADAWTGFNRFCARFLLGIRTRIEGEVPSGAVIVAAKHQSMFETTEMQRILDTPATVMKSELGRIPLGAG